MLEAKMFMKAIIKLPAKVTTLQPFLFFCFCFSSRLTDRVHGTPTKSGVNNIILPIVNFYEASLNTARQA